MPLVTVEEYCEKWGLEPNYIYLLIAAGCLAHQHLLGRTYIDARALEKYEEEQAFWRRQFNPKSDQSDPDTAS